MVLFYQPLALLLSQTSERKHSDLSRDVRPVAWTPVLFESSSEGDTHVSHTLDDGTELSEPFVAVLRDREDLCSDQGTVLWRRRVLLTNDEFDLRNQVCFSDAIGTDKVKGSNTLTVEPHNLGEGLSNNHLEALLQEVAETEHVNVHIAGRESLVGSVEERIVLLALAYFGNLHPLFVSWIDTCRIVCTRVQHHDRARIGLFKVSKHACEVETICLFVEVSVLVDFEPCCGKYPVVVEPGGVAYVNGSVSELL